MNAHQVEFIHKAACEAHDLFIEEWDHEKNCRTNEEMFSEPFDLPDPECKFCCMTSYLTQVVADLAKLLEELRNAGR
jgi:hypothetical protein